MATMMTTGYFMEPWKVVMRRKSHYRAGIAVVLTVAIVALLCFSSPFLVRAFSTSISVIDSPISGNTTYLLGEQVSLPASIQFAALESKEFQSISVNVTGPESFARELPIDPGTYQYTSSDNVPGTLDVTVAWSPGIGPYGYGYGYGYSTGSGNISYDIKWTPPYTLTTPPTPPPTALPGADEYFWVSQGSCGLGCDPGETKSIAYDGTYLYIVVHGFGSEDVIIVTTDSGDYVDCFPAPAPDTQGLAFIGSTLYAAYNEWSGYTEAGFIKKYNLSTGYPTSSADWVTITGLSNLSSIGGMTAVGGTGSDNTSLWIAHRNDLTIVKRDSTTGNQITSFDLNTTLGDGGMGMGGPMIWGIDCIAYDSSGEELYIAQWNWLYAIDKDTGDKTGEYDMAMQAGMWDIRGLTFVSETYLNVDYNILYLAMQWPGKVHRASTAGAVPVVENTPIGDYDAEFRVIADSTEYTDTSSFTLSKLTTAPTVTIDAPTQGFAVGTGSESITVSGSIDDPSISTVTVGIALPTVTAFEDDMEDTGQCDANWYHTNVSGEMMWGPPYSSEDLWHRSSNRDHSGSGWSWRYAKESTGNYETPGYANAGVLQTKTAYSIGDDNNLTFWTWYDTEMDFWPDRKVVEVSTDNSTWEPVAWLAAFWPPFKPPDISQAQYDTLTMVPLMQWTQVEVSLASYAGQSLYIRFRFDAMDDWSNQFEGWYIDEVNISGAGFQGETVNVGADLTFSTQFTLAEGSNVVSVTARRTSYEPTLTGEASVTGSLDTAAPVVALSTVTTPTNQSTQVLTGTVTELNFDRLTMKVNGTEQYSTTVLTENTTGVGTFLCTATLSSGTNTILVTVTDDVGLSATDTTTIVYDAVGPAFNAVFPASGNTTYDVAYKTGEVSARPGDFFFICLNVTDSATGVASVKLAVPDEPNPANWPSAMKFVKGQPTVSQIPEAVIDSWGIKDTTKDAMNYVLPMDLPSGAPAGDYEWTVYAWDSAGNSANLTVVTTVVTTLEAFNIYLMPDWNLVSTPLIPTTDNITTLTADINTTGLFERVWYYDPAKAGADKWRLYVPGVGGDLTTIETGKGYWFKMKSFADFDTAGRVSDPMATGLPRTPAPVKLTIAGQVLQPGAVVPPTYTVYTGWNLVGLHSEYSRPVSTALGSVTVPTQTWGSLLQYLNYIYFPMRGAGEPEIDLGRFDRLISTDTMLPGRGYWLYMVQDGVIVP